MGRGRMENIGQLANVWSVCSRHAGGVEIRIEFRELRPVAGRVGARGHSVY